MEVTLTNQRKSHPYQKLKQYFVLVGLHSLLMLKDQIGVVAVINLVNWDWEICSTEMFQQN